MGQGDAVDRVASVIDLELVSDRLHQRSLAKELGNRELPDREHECGFEQGELPFEPRGAI